MLENTDELSSDPAGQVIISSEIPSTKETFKLLKTQCSSSSNNQDSSSKNKESGDY